MAFLYGIAEFFCHVIFKNFLKQICKITKFKNKFNKNVSAKFCEIANKIPVKIGTKKLFLMNIFAKNIINMDLCM